MSCWFDADDNCQVKMITSSPNSALERTSVNTFLCPYRLDVCISCGRVMPLTSLDPVRIGVVVGCLLV